MLLLIHGLFHVLMSYCCTLKVLGTLVYWIYRMVITSWKCTYKTGRKQCLYIITVYLSLLLWYLVIKMHLLNFSVIWTWYCTIYLIKEYLFILMIYWSTKEQSSNTNSYLPRYVRGLMSTLSILSMQNVSYF